MTKILILIICAIAAGTAFIFFWQTLMILMTTPDHIVDRILSLSITFGLFMAASTTFTTAWQRKKAALWCWLPVFLFWAPTSIYWAYETTKPPVGIQFTREQDAGGRSLLEEILRPTRAEFDEKRRITRNFSLSLLGVLSFQMAALIFLRRKQVLQ